MTTEHSGRSLRGALVVLALLSGACGDDAAPAKSEQDAGGKDDGRAGEGGDAHDAGGSGDPEPGAPTFSAIYEEIIVATGCNGGPLCHGGLVGMLRMNTKKEAYDSLVGVPAMGTNLADTVAPNCEDTDLVRVVPEDPGASLLMQKIDPPGGEAPCGSAMPPTGMLEPAQIEQIRTWIANGAEND